jgi:HEAT repeat protein
MGFYDLKKEKREEIVSKMSEEIRHAVTDNNLAKIIHFASDNDTYIRKNAYLAIGRLYVNSESQREAILGILRRLLEHNNEKVRQTTVYALGEIGKIDAEKITNMLEQALSDNHHSVRNAVIGSLKQMGEKNPKPTLDFAKKFLHHPDPKIRREIIHGIELRGRTHPEDILPLLAELQDDPDKKIIETIVHVLGQISYKKGCLEKVVCDLNSWNNKELVKHALAEIINVHRSYEKFSTKTSKEAEDYIKQNSVIL